MNRLAAINARMVWAAFLFVLPPVSHAQPATGKTPPCTHRFPYEPEKFLEKLLVVADRSDVAAVPAEFQRVFNTKLRITGGKAGSPAVTYGTQGCEWYTHVLLISNTDPKSSLTLVSVGDLTNPLLFGGSGREECLQVELADRSIRAYGWKGGLTPVAETVMWIYRRGNAELGFVSGGDVNPGIRCVSMIEIRFHGGD